MGFLEALARAVRTVTGWVEQARGWLVDTFSGDPCAGAARELPTRVQALSDAILRIPVGPREVETWSDFDRYAYALEEHTRELLRAASQCVNNRGGNPVVEYGVVLLAACQALYERQRNLPGHDLAELTTLQTAGLAVDGHRVELSWSDIAHRLGDPAPAGAGLSRAYGVHWFNPIHENVVVAGVQRMQEWFRHCRVRDQEPRPSEVPERIEHSWASSVTRLSESATLFDRRGRTFMVEQQDTADELLDAFDEAGQQGVFLIRGLAGTGKTVVLALLLPHLVERLYRSRGSLPRVLVYHFTSYLRGTLQREVSAALGAATREHLGLEAPLPRVTRFVENYWDLCCRVQRETRADFGSLRRREDLIPWLEGLVGTPQWDRLTPLDLILVDEAQDLQPSELRLLRTLLRKGGTMIVAYDNFQSLYVNHGSVRERIQNAMPGVEPTEVQLRTCIRSNPAVFSFALSATLGPGLPASDRDRVFDALGLDGLIERGEVQEVPWPGRSGLYLYDCLFCHYPDGPMPFVGEHQSPDAMYASIADAIEGLCEREGGEQVLKRTVLLLGVHIPTLRTLAEYLGERHHRGQLPPIHFKSGVAVDEKQRQGVVVWAKDHHIDLVVTSSTEKKRREMVDPGVVNIATVHDAKGAEADVVFLVNPDSREYQGTDLEKRALFYVGATRAKVLLRVDGLIGAGRVTPILRDAKATFDAMGELVTDEGTASSRVEESAPRTLAAPGTPNGAVSGRAQVDGLGVALAGGTGVTALSRDSIIGVTRGLDHAGTCAVDLWMDHVPGSGVVGGFGHRFIHGHHLSDALAVYSASGLDGLWDYSQHMGRDLMTPHGLPVPGGKLAFDLIDSVPGVDLSLGFAVDWLCFNVADLLSASLGGLALYRTARRSNDGTTLFMAAGAKLVLGMVTTNPLMIGGAVLGSGVAIARVIRPRSPQTPAVFLPRSEDGAQLHAGLVSAGVAELIRLPAKLDLCRHNADTQSVRLYPA